MTQDFKVHIILLDNRFSYDKSTGDFLGPTQWNWLENTLATHTDANVTLIMAGIQILRDNTSIEEQFGWLGKSKLFSLISKFKLSNVVLLSGDVHYSNMYQSSCESFSGYTIPEFSSSGMTHNMGLQYGGVPKFMENVVDVLLDPNYSVLKAFKDYNFGHITLDRAENSLKISIRDINGAS
jgi:hypothetical protein